MFLLQVSVLLLAVHLVSATNLFIADYMGKITTASLSDRKGKYDLKSTSVATECGVNPSWLTVDAAHGVLYCMNEGLNTVNGSLSSFTINRNGSFSFVQNTITPGGPVNGVIYGNSAGPRGLALAHYGGSAVSTWKLEGGGKFSLIQTIPFTLSKPGPNPDRQQAPYEHQAIMDPTGQYLLVPDLGADLVRVFSYDADSLALKALKPLIAAPGSGPRHAAFWNPYSTACDSCATYLFLVSELASTVTQYSVSYLPDLGGLEFKRVFKTPTFGPFVEPVGNAPAEIHVSPDNRFLVISNRNDSSFAIPQRNGSTYLSDSLSTFALSDDCGPQFVQLWPAGGSFPRHFTINSAGNLVAVGLQYSKNVVVLKRDVQTGLIGEFVASIPIDGNVTCVMWGE